MQDDDAMDALLRQALAAPVPQLSPGFDERMRRRLRPRRLTPAGRAVMVAYAMMALLLLVGVCAAPPRRSPARRRAVSSSRRASAYARRLVFGG